MCVLYVSFGSNVRPRTVGCVAMGSAVLFIFSPDCLYILQVWCEQSAGSFVWI